MNKLAVDKMRFVITQKVVFGVIVSQVTVKMSMKSVVEVSSSHH